MVGLTQTQTSAPEVTNEGDEHKASFPSQKEEYGINGSSSSPLEIFAQEASNNAKTISDFLRSNDLDHPSFERNAPVDAFTSAPKDVLTARSKLTEAAQKLLDLARGPQEYIPNLAVNVSKI